MLGAAIVTELGGGLNSTQLLCLIPHAAGSLPSSARNPSAVASSHALSHVSTLAGTER